MKILNAVISESVALFLGELLNTSSTLKDANDQLTALTGIIDFFSNEADWQVAMQEVVETKSEVNEHNAVEYGDFQTNESLAMRVCKALATDGYCPTIVIEPTCGQGNFVLAALRQFSTVRTIYGIEIYKPYLYQCK